MNERLEAAIEVLKTKESKFEMSVRCCARCGGNHMSLPWYCFSNYTGSHKYWTLCPAYGEPILMRVEND